MVVRRTFHVRNAVEFLNLFRDHTERRRYGRIHPEPALRGSVDAIPVFVSEVSMTGARVLHESRLPRASSLHALWFDWQEKTLRFKATFVRTTIRRLARKPGEKTLYETGLHFSAAEENSDQILRELVAEYVIRAINEQLANAHGIPPLAAYSYQSGKGDQYRRCEFVDGIWRKSDTRSPDQPDKGFTISAEIDPVEIELLCRTWELCDAGGRYLTQLLAQLSISKAEGVPTRRYEP